MCQFEKFLHAQAACPEEAAQSSPGDFSVVRNRKGSQVAFLDENHMAPALAHHLPAVETESSHDLSAAQNRQCRHLDGDFDLLRFDGKRHAPFGADFKTGGNGFANVGQGFIPRGALAGASGDGRALGDPGAIFILGERGEKFHNFRLALREDLAKPTSLPRSGRAHIGEPLIP
jgi:hypothetical protein